MHRSAPRTPAARSRHRPRDGTDLARRRRWRVDPRPGGVHRPGRSQTDPRLGGYWLATRSRGGRQRGRTEVAEAAAGPVRIPAHRPRPVVAAGACRARGLAQRAAGRGRAVDDPRRCAERPSSRWLDGRRRRWSRLRVRRRTGGQPDHAATLRRRGAHAGSHCSSRLAGDVGARMHLQVEQLARRATAFAGRCQRSWQRADRMASVAVPAV